MKRLSLLACLLLTALLSPVALTACGDEPSTTTVPTSVGAPQTWFSTAIAGNTVFVNGSECLFAMDSTTGKKRWRFTVEEGNEWYNTAVAAQGEALVVLCSNLYSLDPQTGAELWRFHPDGDADIYSVPAIADGTVCFLTTDGYLQAVDLATGKARWKVEKEFALEGDQLEVAPAASGSTVYYTEADGRLTAIDSATGRSLWASSAAKFDAYPAGWCLLRS
jgi:outer membrane protein assembly factor BamB